MMLGNLMAWMMEVCNKHPQQAQGSGHHLGSQHRWTLFGKGAACGSWGFSEWCLPCVPVDLSTALAWPVAAV